MTELSLSEIFIAMFTPTNILWFFASTFIGIVAGALPGIGASLTMALLIPITFYMDRYSARMASFAG